MGRNYTGHSPKPLKFAPLRYLIEHVLAEELRSVPEAVIVPLGGSVSGMLRPLADAGIIEGNRCLWGFPHPSGANGHRVREFQERRAQLREQLWEWTR